MVTNRQYSQDGNKWKSDVYLTGIGMENAEYVGMKSDRQYSQDGNKWKSDIYLTGIGMENAEYVGMNTVATRVGTN